MRVTLAHSINNVIKFTKIYGVFSVCIVMSRKVFAELAMQQTVGFPVRPSGVESSDVRAPIDRIVTPIDGVEHGSGGQ